MSPNSIIAPPPEKDLLAEVVDQQSPTVRPEGVARSRSQRPEDTAPRGRNWLSDALLEMSPTRPGQRTLDFVLSLSMHALLLVTLVLIPLFFTEALDLKKFTQTFLVAPPPPPPPPPPASPAIVKAVAPKRVDRKSTRLNSSHIQKSRMPSSA